ncbi:MAG: hypothetical protein WAU58_07440 [Terriglobales bacterium]
MALARIISDSVECSQELAASLEERGYAIEIVSPDAIPGHPADLELRVETSPDNVLTARVETHNGPRSASLDFVHYLNQPMPDFRRRVPEALESSPVRPPFVASSAQPAAVATEQAVPPEQTPEPACLLPAAPVVFADPTPVISTPSVDFSVTSGAVESAQATPTEQAPEPARRSWPVVRVIISRLNANPKPKSVSTWEPKRIPRPEPWLRRFSAAAAALVLAASLLSLGKMRPSDAGAISKGQNPSHVPQTPASQLQAGHAQTDPTQTDRLQTGDDESRLSADLNMSADPPLATSGIDHSVVSAVEAGKLKGKKSSASRVSAASSVKSATLKPRRYPRTHRADLIAPNTITYFDRPGAKPTVVKPAQQRAAPSQKRGGVVAARSVAALNVKADPKAGPDK